MKKVVWISDFPLRGSSFGTVTFELLTRMPKEYSFEVLSLGYEGTPLKLADNIRIFELKKGYQLRYYYSKLKPDISVVFHSFWLLDSMMGEIDNLTGKRILYLPCIPEREFLQTGTGMKRIDTIRKGESLGIEGDKKINRVFVNDFEGYINVIKGRGLLPLRLTDEHPVFIRTLEKRIHRRKKEGRFYDYFFNEIKQKKASSIIKRDFLVFPKLKVAQDSSVTREEAAFLGIYLAEGWARKDGEIFVSFGSHEKKLISDYISLVKRLYKKTPHVAKEEKNSVKIFFLEHELAKKLRLLGKATEKQIPSEYMRMRVDYIPIFFEWLRGGDGYFKDEYPTITTSSVKLALQIQKLLSRINTFASISQARPGGGRGNIQGRNIIQRPLYQISVTSDMEKLGYKRMRKITRKMFRDEDEFLIPVMNVRKEFYKGKVFNFCTNKNVYEYGNILTHNCEGEDIPYQYQKHFTKFDVIATPSEFSRKIMKKGGINATVVPHGVDTNFFVPKKKPWHEFRFGYLGLNDIRKQLPRVFEAFARLKEGMLVVAAENEGHYDLTQLAKQYQITPIFIEAKLNGLTMNREAIRDFLQSLDVYISPASESFGIPALEAQACGVPVIASSHGASQEVLGNGAVYCGIADYLETSVGKIGLVSTADLYRKMRFMIQVKDALERTSTKALANSKKWTWENSVQKMTEVLES